MEGLETLKLGIPWTITWTGAGEIPQMPGPVAMI